MKRIAFCAVLACTPPPSARERTAPVVGTVDAAVPEARMPDEEVGALIERLSERPGEFPSDNYVSNETSLLDVAEALRNPEIRGRAYVGVGPEQNYTYLALLDPSVAYIVDIRRGNLLEHLVLRGCFENGATRAEFLSALLARPAPASPAPDIAVLETAFAGMPGVPALRDTAIARTRALLDRLRIARSSSDDDEIARIHEAFFARSLGLAYTMKGTYRKYPTLAENLAAHDASGTASSFLATEETYQRVRRMVIDNRVRPVVGDFGGTHALRAVADDIRARQLLLGALYTSNVEQYLFDAHTYREFIASVTAMPRDEKSLVIRVWFDQGVKHPAQRTGHRTTQLAVPVNAFLARAEKKPFRSYWEVATQ
jgi:hypothetical protein